MNGLRRCLATLLGLAALEVPITGSADDLDRRLQERREAGREDADRRSRQLETQTRENRRAVQERLESRDAEARQRHEAVKERARQPWGYDP
ncbi:MAG TPA: hypothetical protein DHV78_04740 [Alcanivorax sp.]|jgi:hypothetical protein|nr:hypothetical protein [Alcanivorax sp.]|tara:strand:+ start:2430 stop:2705 length:276 start_codon:yes stop_codon:yes gene_type:complete